MSANPSQIPPAAETLEPPDWESITCDVKCPLCGYNLRGLEEPRCPECGYQFQWASVFHPERDLHPYLFEHHPRRNVRTFFQTLFRSPLSSSRFWHTLEPVHAVRVRRLVLYWVIYATAGMLPIVVPFVWIAWNQASSFYLLMQPWPGRLRYLVPESGLSGILACVIVFSLFPWFNFLALLIFQQSMRRARVRPVHVLRCAIYCGDMVLWCSLALVIVLAVTRPDGALQAIGHPIKSFFLGVSPGINASPILVLLGIGILVMLVLNGVRLWVAYRVYLRMDRALALIIASQIVVIFAILAVLSLVTEQMR